MNKEMKTTDSIEETLQMWRSWEKPIEIKIKPKRWWEFWRKPTDLFLKNIDEAETYSSNDGILRF